jgi:hypothetical protein
MLEMPLCFLVLLLIMGLYEVDNMVAYLVGINSLALFKATMSMAVISLILRLIF